MSLEERKKEFIKNRTFWKFFERKILQSENIPDEFQLERRMLLEVLKELQFMNDMKLKTYDRS